MRETAPIVLVVEDEWLLRDGIVGSFREAGWQVFDASTGEAAVALLAAERISVAFTDIRLGGGLTGWDVGEACFIRNVPIVYASSEAAAARVRAVPGSRFFEKPYNAVQVVAACEACRRKL